MPRAFNRVADELTDADAAPAVPAPGAAAPGADALGRAIAVRRLELGISRRELAQRSGLSYPFVCEIERGAKQPSGPSLQRLADALQLRVADLYVRVEALAQIDVAGSDGPAALEPGDAIRPTAPPPSWREPSGSPGRAEGVRAAATDDLSRLVRGMVRDELARLQAGGAPPLPRAGASAGGGARAPLATDEEVREHVLFAARQMLGTEDIEFDEEGDIPVKRGDVMLFIRVLDDPLSVLVFSPILVGVTESHALFSRLNELNAGVHFIRFCVTHGGVVADIELFGSQFRPGLLGDACRAISEMAESTGPDLQAEFGGRLFFGDEQRAKPPRDTGGYL
jgi:transcriptional regulator with XRE-family HTH domain